MPVVRDRMVHCKMAAFLDMAMSQPTFPTWLGAALDILLWLLDPERDKAEAAYLHLFNRLVKFFRKQHNSSNAEDFAEQALTKVAEIAYRELEGIAPHERSRDKLLDELRQMVGRSHGRLLADPLPQLAIDVAKGVLRKQARKNKRPDVGILEALRIPDQEDIGRDERLLLLEDALSELAPEDRDLIEEYYNSDRDREELRSEVANQLGITEQALRSRVENLKKRIKRKMVAHEAPVPAQFTAYYPRSVERRNWSTILAYMHVADALEQVHSDSKRRISGVKGETGKKTTNRKVGIARGAQIIVVPESKQLEFNPSAVAFAWIEDFHCAEFRCRARWAREGIGLQQAAVKITFYVAPVLVAEISLTIGIDKVSEQKRRIVSVTANPYQRVFVSYSHSDSNIANQLEKAYSALGIEYLRDVRMLRSGENWAPALLRRIEESEIFQLLWSKAAKRSDYVRQEWQHALSLQRNFFIRPVYWEKPMPAPPQELAAIHFAYLELRNKHL